MSLSHGINTYKDDTNFSMVKEAAVGIPFYIGAWPCHQGKGYVDKPQVAYSFSEAQELGGYSTAWRNGDGSPKWNLCQAMYAQFNLNAMSPAVFCNVFNPSKHKTAVEASSLPVKDHVITLPGEAINDESLTVTKEEETTLTLGKDYEVYYDGDNCLIELLQSGQAYGAETLKVGYNAANPSAITAQDIEAAVEKIEMCMALFGFVPDLICAPGWSSTPAVAAVMAAKAPAINGLFKGKAVVDIDTAASSGADSYDKVLAWKNKNGYTDENMIVCWPLVQVGDYLFDYSAYLCGKIASIDQGNADCPYESPSNKSISITGACNKAGNEICLSVQQADMVSVSAGVVTVLNHAGWVVWGNYTGCYPAITDVAKMFICCNRMQDFLCNTFTTTYWSYIDKPLSRVTIDAIVNSFNSFLNGLTHDGKLYGGEIQYVPDNNPTANLIAGKIRLDLEMASPVPAQQVDMHETFNVDLMTVALSA